MYLGFIYLWYLLVIFIQRTRINMREEIVCYLPQSSAYNLLEENQLSIYCKTAEMEIKYKKKKF